MDLTTLVFFVVISGMLSAILVALNEISGKLTKIAELLVWQVESDDDGEPDGPDEGEPAPRGGDLTVVPIRRRA